METNNESSTNDDFCIIQVFGDMSFLITLIIILVLVASFTVMKPVLKNVVEIEGEQLRQILFDLNKMESQIVTNQQKAAYQKLRDIDAQKNDSDFLRTWRERELAKKSGRFTKFELYLKVDSGQAFIVLSGEKIGLGSLTENIVDLQKKKHYIVVYAKADAMFPVGYAKQVEERVRSVLRSYGDWNLEIAKKIKW